MRYTHLFFALPLVLAAQTHDALAQTATTTETSGTVAAAAANPVPQPAATALQPIPTTPATAPATTTTTTVTTPAVTSTQTTTTNATAPAATGTVAAPAAAVPANGAALTKEQQNQAAVQAILGDQVRKVAPPVPAAKSSALNAKDLLAQGVVVTPAAKEVVTVKKGARANTDRAIFVAADRAYGQYDYATAADLYGKILAKSPRNKLALYGKALSLQKAGRTDEALPIYERLALLDPTNVNATANYMTLLRQKDPQKALGRLQTLEQQYPGRPNLQGQIGLIYADMNDTPNAIRAFSRAAALDPNNPVYAFNLGALYDRLGNDQKAAQQYRVALGIAADNPSKANTIASDAVRERLKELDY